MNWRPRAILLVLALAAVSILANARLPDPQTGQERSSQFAGALDTGNMLEQSFVPTRNNLAAVDVFALIPPGHLSADYTITLRMREEGAAEDVAVWRLPLQQVQRQRRLTITFPPQPHSMGRRYALRVETTAPPDTVSLLASDEDVYPLGELRLNGSPVPNDLTFRTYTAIRPLSLLFDARSVMLEYLLLLALTVYFCLIGGALLILLGHFPGITLTDGSLWSVGVGLAVVPVVYLFFGQSSVWVFVILIGLAVLRLLWRMHLHSPVTLPRPSASDGLLLLLFLWSLLVRCLQIRDVPVPMWVDGLRHYDMAKSILESGRIPDGLLYHVGYHIHAALLLPLTGTPLPRLLLLLGQWISAFNGPALYVLALPMFSIAGVKQRRAAALIAATLLSCLPSLPGYLMNWGRYPFLLGLTLLPFFLALLAAAVAAPPSRTSWKAYTLLLLLLVGMMLSHYGMLSFSASFAIVLLALRPAAWICGWRSQKFVGFVLLFILLGIGLLAVRFGDNLLPRLTETIAQSRENQEGLRSQDLVQILLRGGGGWLVTLGSLGAVWAYLRARPLLWLSVGWFAVQALLTALQAPFLGYGLASYTNLLLALSIPLAVLAGAMLSEASAPTASSRRILALPLILALLALSGGLSQMGILNPAALSFSQADAAAMDWIRANTASEACFLINATPWGIGELVSSDGGGWITPLTQRPSVLTDRKIPSANIKEIDYVYLGHHAGLLTRALVSSLGLQVVYDRQGITIYAVTP